MILLTGAAGYIGSHLFNELTTLGYDIIAIDNYSNPQIDSIQVDIRNLEELDNVMNQNIDTVIHLAAKTSIPESILNPIDYYENNVLGTINLINCMKKNNVKNLIFSSSASIYADNIEILNEKSLMMPKNPYAKSKHMAEKMLLDLKGWNILILRFFNVAGLNRVGSFHLFPSILKTIDNPNKQLTIFGKNYFSTDGTAIRDYVHVLDVVDACIAGLKTINNSETRIYNIGSGVDSSVLDVVRAFEKITGKSIPVQFSDARKNEMFRCVADITSAQNKLGWKPKFDLQDIIQSCLV